jgi:argininosuccinate lyase
MTETVSLVGAIAVLAGALAYVVRQRRNGHWNRSERRADSPLLLQIQEEIKELRTEWRVDRQDVHDFRERVLTPLLVQVESIRKDVEHLLGRAR